MEVLGTGARDEIMCALDRPSCGTECLINRWLRCSIGIDLGGRHLVKAVECLGSEAGTSVGVAVDAARHHDWSWRRHIDEIFETAKLHARWRMALLAVARRQIWRNDVVIGIVTHELGRHVQISHEVRPVVEVEEPFWASWRCRGRASIRGRQS